MGPPPPPRHTHLNFLPHVSHSCPWLCHFLTRDLGVLVSIPHAHIPPSSSLTTTIIIGM